VTGITETIRRWFGADVPRPSTQSPAPSTLPIGVVGTSLFGGYVRDLGEYNAKLQPPGAFQIYEKMRRSDADVAAALLACKLPIRAAESQIVPGVEDNDPGFAAAKEIAEFVEDNLLGGLEYISPAGIKVSQSFEKVVENALLMLDFGCFAHEEIYAIDGAQVRLARLAPRLPSTFTRFYADTDGETLLSLEQRGYRGDKYETVNIPADRFTLFIFAQEGANFWGRSILRPAYKHWYVKEQLERILALAGEKNGLGVPVIKQAADASKEDREAAALWVERLAAHEKTGLSLPFGWDFALKGVEGRPQDVLPAIRYHSEMIARSVLATFLTLGTTQTGTRSLGESSTGFFKLALESTAWLLAETISQTTIRRLVDFNFGTPKAEGGRQKAAYPYLRFGNILATDPLEVLKVAKDLVTNGVLQVGDEDEGYVREQLGWPKKTTPRAPAVAPGLGTGDGSQKAEGGRQKAEGGSQKEEDQSKIKNQKSKIEMSEGTSRASQRQLKQWEQKVDYAALRRRQDATAKKVARILRAAKPAAAKLAANLAGRMRPLELQRLALPTDMNVIAQIQQAVTPAFEFGRTSVRRERYRATGRRGAGTRDSGLGTRGSGGGQLLAADRLQRAKNAPRLVAEATWADFANWISPRAIAAAVDARKRGLEGAELEEGIGAALGEMPDGGLDKIGMEAGRGALAGGRYATLADFDAEISRYIRTEADDDRVCEVCNAADGTEWESLDEVDWQPGDDCEGGDLCRGQLVAVFADEGTVTSD